MSGQTGSDFHHLPPLAARHRDAGASPARPAGAARLTPWPVTGLGHALGLSSALPSRAGGIGDPPAKPAADGAADRPGHPREDAREEGGREARPGRIDEPGPRGGEAPDLPPGEGSGIQALDPLTLDPPGRIEAARRADPAGREAPGEAAEVAVPGGPVAPTGAAAPARDQGRWPGGEEVASPARPQAGHDAPADALPATAHAEASPGAPSRPEPGPAAGGEDLAPGPGPAMGGILAGGTLAAAPSPPMPATALPAAAPGSVLTPEGITQIAVGSSQHIWALDGTSNQLWRRNEVTQNSDPVTSNIPLSWIDVGSVGDLVALNPQGVLFVWDPATGRFVRHEAVGETFDQVFIGKESLWGLREGTAFLWDSASQGFVAVLDGVAALAVGKQDDSAFVIDADGNLLQFDSASFANGDDPGDWWDLLSSAPGVTDLVGLSAVDASHVWGLAADGGLYQLNPVDFAPDSTVTGFVAKSQALGVAGESFRQIQVDEKGVVYGVTDTALRAIPAAEAAIQGAFDEQTYDVEIAKDSNGILHLVYSTESALYHSFYFNGEWVRAQAIPGSTQGSEIRIDADDAGNIYVSWIGGYGNAAEVYASKGAASTGYSGYVFSEAVQVTDDEVEDQDLALAVTPDGIVTLTAAKKDANDPHDDLDVYAHSLDGHGSRFALPGTAAATRDDSRFVAEYDPLDLFLASAGTGAAPPDALLFTPLATAGFKFKVADLVEIRVLFRPRLDFAGEDFQGDEFRLDSQVKAGFDLKGILKKFGYAPTFLGDLKLSALLIPQVSLGFADDLGSNGFSFKAGLVSDVAVDLLGAMLGTLTGSTYQLVQKSGAFDLQAGLFNQLQLTWTLADVDFSDGTADPAAASIPPPPGELVTLSGEPVTERTPAADLALAMPFADYFEWAIGAFLSQLGTVFGESPGVGGVAAASDFSLQFYGGVYAKYSVKGPKGFISYDVTSGNLRAGLQFQTAGGEIQKIGERTTLDFTAGPWAWRPIDTFVSWSLDDGSTRTAQAPGTAQYVVGGTSGVHGIGTLVLGGTGEGSLSDKLDTEGFNYVLLPDGRAFGVFVQEVLDQAQASQNTVNTIEGVYDPVSRTILWNEASIATLPGSAGLNLAPRIALHGDDQLVITWGNTPSDDPNLVALNATPPGKAYVVFGGPGRAGATIDLAGLGTTPVSAGDGFALTNDQTLFGIGASVAALGDINPGMQGGGRPDFAFGAPDAEAEAGKVYVVFGENYLQAGAIDSLSGSTGFTFLGETDDELGYQVVDAGDVNGDGIADVAVSAPGAFNQRGAVYVLYGGDWSLKGPGPLSVRDIGTLHAGTVLQGSAEGDRWGTALGGGQDVTGDGRADLAIGSAIAQTITIASLDGHRITIDVNAESAATTTGSDVGAEDIGGSVAMLPDLNGDGDADLVIGSSYGTAYVLLGGERFAAYGDHYVASLLLGPDHQVLLSFDGTDANGDGILSTAGDEITAWRMEVFDRGVLAATYTLEEQAAVTGFEFSFDLAGRQVLANAGAGATDPAKEVYGLDVGLDRQAQPTGSFWSLASNAAEQSIELRFVPEGADAGTVVARTDALDGALFSTVSTPGSFDLQALDAFPGLGFALSVDSPLALTGAAAGDVNGDGIEDLILGYGQSTDAEGNPVDGRSYVLYGRPELGSRSGIIDLDALLPEEGFVIPGAGGRVSGAGDIDGDGHDDLLVSAPDATGPDGAESAGLSYIVFGSPSGPGAMAFTLADSKARETSGSALAPLGDLNGDGYGDVLVGAPQTIDVDAAQQAQGLTRLLASIRDLAGGGWSEGQAVNGGAQGEYPAALADTPRGTLLAWVDYDPGNQAGPYILRGAFFDGTAWSADGLGGGGVSAIIRQSDRPMTDVTIASAKAESGSTTVPLIVWIEKDIAQSQSAAIFQSEYDPKVRLWRTPEAVNPTPSEVPAVIADPAPSALRSGTDILTVDDIVASEADGTAAFHVTRSGDLSRESGVYHYRLFDHSATFGSDYGGAHAGSFRFAAGQDSQAILVELLSDTLYEGRPERVRLEIWSEEEGAFGIASGLATPGDDRIAASLLITESEPVLKLASIQSGFQLDGAPSVSLGYALQSAGRFNGDALADFMVAAPAAGGDGAGKVYLLYGAEGIEISAQDLDLDTLTAAEGVILTGTVAEGAAGAALAHWESAQGAGVVAIGAPGSAAEDGPDGRVYLVRTAQVAGQQSVALDATRVLEVVLDGQEAGSLFGRSVLLADLNGNGKVDLIVGARDAVRIAYDIDDQAGATGRVDFASLGNVTTITNGEGTGFGTGIAVLDFDGDGVLDLVLGSTQGNRLDASGIDLGAGGFVAVIRGRSGSNTFGANVDVADLGASGFRFLGEAGFVPEDQSDVAGQDADTPVTSGSPLVDGVGGALATLDLNGDGAEELVIGAPGASTPDADGLYTLDNASVGRVYVLFGGDASLTDWRTLTGDYLLTDLYGGNTSQAARYRDGLVLEGTVPGGLAGWSVANAGAFRGTTDLAAGVEDLAIGAPGAYGGAGAAYVVFGSQTNYDDLGKGQNVFAIDPTGDGTRAGTLPVFGFQGDAAALGALNPQNTGAVGAGLAGLGDINGIGSDDLGGSDLGLGAPTSDQDGVAKVYIANGHPWLQPGDSLDVADLRSDNGFVLPGADPFVAPVGDFNGDGYEDFGQATADATRFTVTLGASVYDAAASTNRVVTLDALQGLLGGTFAAGDFDGDGVNEILAALRSTGAPEGEMVFYTPDALADAETRSLAPQSLMAGSALDDLAEVAAQTGLALDGLYTATGDLNGDGYDDLLLSSGNDVTVVAFGTAELGRFSWGGGRTSPATSDAILVGVADLDGDGRDEVLLQSRSSPTREIRVQRWNAATEQLETAVTYPVGPIFQRYAASGEFTINKASPIESVAEAGDLNGDGYEDVVVVYDVTYSFYANDIFFTQVPVYWSVVFYGAASLGSSGASSLIVPSPYIDSKNTTPTTGEKMATIIGDANGDGLDDLLIGAQATVLRTQGEISSEATDSALLYGSPEGFGELLVVPRIDTLEDYPFAGLLFDRIDQRAPNHLFGLAAGGDLNGDGLADLVLADATNLDLTFAVFGEVWDPQAGTQYLDGTQENDFIVQTGSDDATVVIRGLEGDDILQSLAGYQVLLYGGAGDDQLAIGQTDSAEIIRIDGGTGFDTLILDEVQLGELNTLDLTRIRGRVTGIEAIDLGLLNGLAFDLDTVRDLTGGAAPLILKGVQAQAKPRVTKSHDGWSLLGEAPFDGDLYEVYRFTFEDGTQTTTQVWIQKGGVEWRPLLSGTAEPDRLAGQAGADDLAGEAGADTLIGAGGDDGIDGGDGDDRALGGAGADSLAGGTGADTLGGGPGADSLAGGPGADRIIGGAGRDSLSGGDGGDEVVGGEGSDLALGGAGDDRLVGGGGRDSLAGEDGQDTLHGGAGSDSLAGGQGDDALAGGAGRDLLRGGEGADSLTAGEGADSLEGEAGADRLSGGDGWDTLRGGEGEDTLLGGAGADLFLLSGGAGIDTIRDFAPGLDRIGLSGGLDPADLAFAPDGPDTRLLLQPGGETLAILAGLAPGALSPADFVLLG